MLAEPAWVLAVEWDLGSVVERKWALAVECSLALAAELGVQVLAESTWVLVAVLDWAPAVECFLAWAAELAVVAG